MAVRSRFSSWDRELRENLASIHERIRANDLAGARKMFKRYVRFGNSEYVDEEIRRESEFLRAIDESHALEPQKGRLGNTVRQAIIYAAVVGWRGDDASDWSSPAEKETLLAWAQSHYGGPDENLEIALHALELEGLYNEVHPGLFEQRCLFPTFDSSFLSELTDGDRYVGLWDELSAQYNRDFRGWWGTGLCHGQGSEGPSDLPYGLCLGTGCVWFREGNEHCNFELRFNTDLLPNRPTASRTVFISYGGPDESFAAKLDRSLRLRQVRTWFFKRDSKPGQKLHDVMREAVNSHQRVVLICSRTSLERAGVLNELEQTLARESREGGSSILLPVVLDDFIFDEWRPTKAGLKQEILDRVVSDFRGTAESEPLFEKAVARLVNALA